MSVKDAEETLGLRVERVGNKIELTIESRSQEFAMTVDMGATQARLVAAELRRLAGDLDKREAPG